MGPDSREPQDNHQHRFPINGRLPSLAVVNAVAHVTDQDPLAFGPIADIIDPDALDDLLTESSSISLSFSINGVEVQVTGSEEIVITEG